jgi:hypothetical protein
MELVVVIGIRFLVDTPRPLGSMLKDSLKIVANWLVRLLESMHDSTVARADVMSIGCCLKGNCSESRSQSRCFLVGRKHCTVSHCGRRGSARIPPNC